MLYSLVAFVALIAIKQWNPLFSSQSAIHPLDNCCLTTYHYHGCPYTMTYDPIDQDPMQDDGLMGSIWHFYDVASGCKTHNLGCNTHNVSNMTHNTPGHATRRTYISSIQYSYSLIPGCMACHPITISNERHHNSTTSYL